MWLADRARSAWLKWAQCAMVLAAVVCQAGLAGSCWARGLPASQQYVNISGLPGGGCALDPLGGVAGEGPGAVQLNIPIAFTPSRGYLALGVWAGDYVPPFRGGVKPSHLLRPERFGNGTGLIAVGLGEPGSGLYLGAMVLSLEGDRAFNLQWQVHQRGGEGLAVGVQDWADTEEGARSLYLVASKALADDRSSPALTVGYGNGRFRDRVFAGMSVRLNEWAYATGEYDGFQFNGGLVLQPRSAGAISPSITLAVNDGDRPLVGVCLVRQER